MAEGRAVGDSVVGISVGDVDMLGVAVGLDNVGRAVGPGVGATDGGIDGCAVGPWVGNDVGAWVGWKSHWPEEQHPFHCSCSI